MIKIRRTKWRIQFGLTCLVALACTGGVIYSGYNILVWLRNSRETQQITEELQQEVQIIAIDEEELESEDETEVVVAEVQPEERTNLYWQFLRESLIDLDFTDLKQRNDEVAGWIQVPGTNINYPFVQTGNNDFYLTHDLRKAKNSAGWVFADYRNYLDGNDKNLILYAHGRYDKTMFGTLRNALTNGWIDNPNNHFIRTVDENESAIWQVFSVYQIETTSDYLRTKFSDDEDFVKFAEFLRGRSVRDFGATVGAGDRIITLSTCYDSKSRVVMHAKLIKKVQK